MYQLGQKNINEKLSLEKKNGASIKVYEKLK